MSDRPRAEHLAFCKKRALAYLDPGKYYSLRDAVASMCSDMSKHDETKMAGPLGLIGMFEIANGENAVRKWINGFN